MLNSNKKGFGIFIVLLLIVLIATSVKISDVFEGDLLTIGVIQSSNLIETGASIEAESSPELNSMITGAAVEGRELSAQATCGLTTPCNCWDDLSSSRTLNSSDNLTGCTGLFALDIGANNLILDCNNYNITGTATKGININGFNNITIRNCSISNFTTGIDVRNSANNTIENNEIYLNNNGIYVSLVDNSNFSSNNIHDNSAEGIRVTGSNSNFFETNTIKNNNKGFIFSNEQGNSKDNIIYNNDINSNLINTILDNSGPFVNTLIYNNSNGLINWTKSNLTNNLAKLRIDEPGIPGDVYIKNNLLGLIGHPSSMRLNATAYLTFTRSGAPTTNYQVYKITSTNTTRCDNTNLCNMSFSGSKVYVNVSSFSNYTTNAAPTIDAVTLTTTNSSSNNSRQNLTAVANSPFDQDSNPIKLIFNWEKNGTVWTLLNMPFEGGSNSTFTRDYSSLSNNGTVSSATYNSTGGFEGSGAYEFDGINDYINTGLSITQVSSVPGVTMMAWVYPLSTASGRHHVISTNNEGFDWSLLANGDHWFAFRGNGEFNSTFTVDTNTWQHIAVVFKPGNGTIIYKNGVASSVGPIDYNLSSSSVSIGRNLGFSDSFNGTIDEVKIFNDSLTSQQINAIYHNKSNLIVSQETSRNDVWQADVTPNDGYQDGVTKTSNNVTILNSAPVFDENLVDQDAYTLQLFTYDINCSDDAGDTITYYDNTTLFDINSTNGNISDVPNETEVGTYNIKITCGDGLLNTSQTFNYTINDATNPSFTNSINISVGFKKYQNFTANITIVDNFNTSHYIFSTNASGSWVNDSAVSITGAQYNASVSKNITQPFGSQICWYYFANDTSGNTNSSDIYCFTVQNTLPYFNEALTNQSINVGETLLYDVNCTDPDLISLSYSDNTSLFNINVFNGLINDTPTFGEVGSHGINITCSDGTDNTSDYFTYIITDTTPPNFNSAINTSIGFRKYQNFTANITINNNNLSAYIFSTNVSGSWVNDSAVSITGAQYNASVSKNITQPFGSQICWYYFANDTSSNGNSSNNYCFTVQNTAPNTTSIIFNSTLTNNYTIATLTCFASASDIDNDSLSLNWELYNNSVLFSSGSTSINNDVVTNIVNVSSSDTVVGENWTCSVFANDGVINESDSNNASIIVRAIQCGDIISTNITLVENLSSNGACFIIGSDNVTINLDGYSITGNGSGIGVNSSNFDGTRVVNGTINNFSIGIYGDPATNLNLNFLTIINGSTAIKLININNSNITNNNITNNIVGINLTASFSNLIYNNIFDNTINAVDLANNSWNITKTLGTNIIGGYYLGGNSWSDYAGVDTDGDGLGNTLLQYNESGNIPNGGDYLPLVVAATATVPASSSGGGGGGGTADCRDGKDNDGDGLIDYPVDPGCSRLGDNSEGPYNEKELCQENWVCSWSSCDSTKKRFYTCVDNNFCGTNNSMPTEKQESCTEQGELEITTQTSTTTSTGDSFLVATFTNFADKDILVDAYAQKVHDNLSLYVNYYLELGYTDKKAQVLAKRLANLDNIQFILPRAHARVLGSHDILTQENVTTKKSNSLTGAVTNNNYNYVTSGSVSGVSFSNEPVTGTLLETKIKEEDSQILVPARETVTAELELEGLSVTGRTIKIQYSVDGQGISQEELFIEANPTLGTSFDIDQENNLLDLYLVIPSKEAGAGSYQLELSILKENQLEEKTTVPFKFDLFNELNKVFSLDKTVLFSDVYGPYNINYDEAFILAQQLTYDSKIYNKGDYILNAIVYKDDVVVKQENFEFYLAGSDSAKTQTVDDTINSNSLTGMVVNNYGNYQINPVRSIISGFVMVVIIFMFILIARPAKLWLPKNIVKLSKKIQQPLPTSKLEKKLRQSNDELNNYKFR